MCYTYWFFLSVIYLNIPPIRFVSQVTQKELRSSLMMAGYCRNMYEPIHRIKERYKSLHFVRVFFLMRNLTLKFYVPTLRMYVGNNGGTGWCSGWGTALQTGRARDRFPMVSLKFFIDIILPAALWPWSRLSLQQKWVPRIFPGVKAAGA
jgi:hypothetical protein